MTAAKQRKTRVLLVSPVGEHGGAEQVFLTLARLLPTLDVDPVLACMRPGPLTELAAGEGVEVHTFREHRYRELPQVVRGVRWLEQLIRRERIDLVHSNLSAHLYGGPAARLARRPELWHIHDFPHRISPFEQLVLRIPTDFALFTTHRVESGFPRLRRGPHAVVYPVCIDASATRLPPRRQDVRELYGLPRGPLLLTVARLQEHKGHRYLIEAVPQVLQSSPDAAFVVVGKASDTMQELYASQLKALCARLSVTESVHFLGYVPDDDLIALYGEASVLVHPALSEGFGLALLQAMAAGVPVVAAASDGPRELIRPGKNGFLAPPGDRKALAELIVQLLESPELAARVSVGARRFAGSFSSTKMAEDTARIYRDVADRNNV